MANAKTNFRNASRRGMHGIIGTYTQALVAELLDAELSPRGQEEYADVFSNDLGIRVEVKARGDNCGLGLRNTQLEKYQQEPPFPIDHSLYALVPYRSRRALKRGEHRPRGIGRKTNMVSIFRDLATDAEIFHRLSENIPIIYLLDLKIILALAKRLGLIRGYFPDRPNEDVLVLNRTRLRAAFQDEDLPRWLSSHGLRSKEWSKGVYSAEVRSRIDWLYLPLDDAWLTSAFTLITVVRADLHAGIARTLIPKTLIHV